MKHDLSSFEKSLIVQIVITEGKFPTIVSSITSIWFLVIISATEIFCTKKKGDSFPLVSFYYGPKTKPAVPILTTVDEQNFVLLVYITFLSSL